MPAFVCGDVYMNEIRSGSVGWFIGFAIVACIGYGIGKVERWLSASFTIPSACLEILSFALLIVVAVGVYKFEQYIIGKMTK
jgi:hypothetical protein